MDHDETTHDDGENPFLRMFAAPEDEEGPEARQEAQETPEAEADDEPQEGQEGGSDTAEKLADDDHLVVVKTGDTERKVSIADLKALLGREEAIVARDKETEAASKKVQAESEKSVAIMAELIKRADAKLKPYQELDWVNARAKLPDNAYEQLRKDAQDAHAHALFLRETGNQFVGQMQANHQARVAAELKACDEAIAKDPDLKGVTRADVKAYAAQFGDDVAASMDLLAAPWAFKVFHKAMLYDKGAAKVAAAVKDPAKTATKTTLKAGTSGEKSNKSAEEAALGRLKKSGSNADAEAYFLARFGGA